MSPRFSPPKDKQELLGLLTGDDSPFSELRDVLFFAAAIGYREQRRKQLDGRGDAIRWETMLNRYGTEELMDMIAVMDQPEDRELLSTSRQSDRVSILEEYANGGLEVIQERIHLSGAVPLQSVFVQLIQSYLSEGDVKRTESGLADKVLNL